MNYGGFSIYFLTYSGERDRILPEIIADLDMRIIPGILSKCTDWHANLQIHNTESGLSKLAFSDKGNLHSKKHLKGSFPNPKAQNRPK